MKIRTATESDLPAIVAIADASIAAGGRTGFTSLRSLDAWREWYREHDPMTHPVLVACVEEAAAASSTDLFDPPATPGAKPSIDTPPLAGSPVVGYLAFSPYRPGRPALARTAELSLFIADALHRCGVGSALLRHAIDLAPTLGLDRLVGYLLATNPASREFFHAHGFELWGTLPGVARVGERDVDHWIVGRVLAPASGASRSVS